MTDSGQGGHDYSLNRNFLNNVVIKSYYKSSAAGDLRFCHLNPGSAAAHVDEMRGLFCDTNLHIIGVSETWYKQWHTNQRISIPGYKVVRADRRDGRRGGGVAVFIRSDLKYKILAKSPAQCPVDYIFLEVQFQRKAVLVGVVYNPPRIDGGQFYMSTLEDLAPCYVHNLLLGDFNTDLLADDDRARELKNRLEGLALKIVSTEATNFSSNQPTLIDICAVSESDCIPTFTQLSLPEMNTSHDMIYGAYRISTEPDGETAQYKYYRNYNNIDLQMLSNDALQQDWDTIYYMHDPESQVRHFDGIVLRLLNSHAPLKKYIIIDNANPWISIDIERAMIVRNIAYRVWKRRRTVADHERYKYQRKLVNILVRRAKRQYMAKFLDPKQPSKTLWRNLKEVGATNSTEGDVLYTADQLNNFFASTQTPPRQWIPTRATTDSFSFGNTHDLEVYNAFSHIKSNAVGTDGVPIRFLRILMPVVLPFLTHIFNTILTSASFPETWKKSMIIPLAKVHDPSSLADYRPISILPVVSKALEIIMRQQILNHIETNHLLNPLQSGFRKNHSTTTALLKITNDILCASDKKLATFLVLLDFKKAFDSVDHGLLCNKLANLYGFSTSAVQLIKSYLEGRSQIVVVDGVTSESKRVISGVVQGSVLGPLLFSLFINDIAGEICNASYHLYADDVQIYISCHQSALVPCCHQLNEDLERVYQWSIANSIQINPIKSQAILFNSHTTTSPPNIKLGRDFIEYYDKVKNLGIIFNNKLKWDDQISKVCSSVCLDLRRMWPMASFTPKETRKKLVTSLIIPKFSYCNEIYGKSWDGLRERLKVSFNNCARYINGVPRSQHISEYTNQILGMPLDTYFTWRWLCLMHKLIANHQPSYLFDVLQFGRSSRLAGLIPPLHRLSAHGFSFFVQGVSLWNGLPLSVREAGSGFSGECRLYLLRSVRGGNS
jgi:Reverse transcriptase (RNA-dependent DNA polymerase)